MDDRTASGAKVRDWVAVFVTLPVSVADSENVVVGLRVLVPELVRVGVREGVLVGEAVRVEVVVVLGLPGRQRGDAQHCQRHSFITPDPEANSSGPPRRKQSQGISQIRKFGMCQKKF